MTLLYALRSPPSRALAGASATRSTSIAFPMGIRIVKTMSVLAVGFLTLFDAAFGSTRSIAFPSLPLSGPGVVADAAGASAGCHPRVVSRELMAVTAMGLWPEGRINGGMACLSGNGHEVGRIDTRGVRAGVVQMNPTWDRAMGHLVRYPVRLADPSLNVDAAIAVLVVSALPRPTACNLVHIMPARYSVRDRLDGSALENAMLVIPAHAPRVITLPTNSPACSDYRILGCELVTELAVRPASRGDWVLNGVIDGH